MRGGRTWRKPRFPAVSVSTDVRSALAALGCETDQIAKQLFISPQTVRTHVRNAMTKLGAHTRAQLVAVVLCTDEAVHATVVERMTSSP